MNTSYSLNILPTTEDAASFYKTCERGDENAGFDLFVPEEHILQPGESKLISMRVKVVLELMFTGGFRKFVHYWMPPRSSISKTGLILLTRSKLNSHMLHLVLFS